MRLAPVLDPLQFSPAERSALRLDGECVPVGLSDVPIDVPIDRVVRAASLAPAVEGHDLVIDTRAAAWVHGAVPELPQPLTLAVDVATGRRTKPLFPAPREVRLEPHDVERLGGVLVTTPLKTAFDLLRIDLDPASEPIAARLIADAGLAPAIAAAMAQAHRGCPNKRRGVDRLAALPGRARAQPALTR